MFYSPAGTPPCGKTQSWASSRNFNGGGGLKGSGGTGGDKALCQLKSVSSMIFPLGREGEGTTPTVRRLGKRATPTNLTACVL